MAQAVIGAMGTLLPKLADLITKEYNLQRGPPDIQVKIWAKDVRDLSYGLEDSIDKFMVRIETDGRPDKSHSFRNFIDKSLSLLTKGKIRHKIGIDIKDIKSRIKEVSDRRDRSKVDNVAAAKPVVPVIDTLRLAALYTKATELVGTDEKSVEMYQNINEASWGEQQLISEIRTFLENKRYLIVIDDIWDKSVWENIKYALIENGYGSRVITTTRVLYVSLQAGGVYRLKPLSVVDSRKLFYQRIYEMENKSPPNQLVEVSERILKRCGGVPLAILAIGSLLSSEKGTTHTHEYWSKVYKSISLGLDNNHDDVKNMRRILSTRNEEVGNQLATVSLSHVRSLSLLLGLLCFRVLRVLDLAECEVYNTHWNDICNLFHLRYLNLRGTSITNIPKEIGNQQFLQVLDIRSGQTYTRQRKRLTTGIAYPFLCLKMFGVKSDTMELRFGRGAMQSLQTLKLDFQDVEDTLFQFGDFALGLENLPSLEDVCVTFSEDTSEKISSVENALRKEIDMNQNKPRLRVTDMGRLMKEK
uniref:Disease resistance protein RPM1 n=1 Tax=Aegilops tauschii TaxID=37682 RepID=M8C4D0_AEGTA